MGTKNKPGTYDCYATAHPDEPMFILLGRERERGPSPKVEEARACAKAMRAWQDGPMPTQVSIVVNGNLKQVAPSKGLSYTDLVALAEMSGSPSITVRTEHSRGTMYPGSGTIVPSEGMVVNVAHTGNA